MQHVRELLYLARQIQLYYTGSTALKVALNRPTASLKESERGLSLWQLGETSEKGGRLFEMKRYLVANWVMCGIEG